LSREQYNRLLSDIKNGLPVVLALWDTKPSIFDLKLDVKQQHAVTAYSIIDLGDEKRVYVYNNEVPLKNLTSADYATYTASSNQFSFDNFNRIIALPIEYSLYPGSLSLLIPNIESSVKEAINDLWSRGQMLLWGHSPVKFLVTDENGRRIGYLDGTFVNEIPGAAMEEVYGSQLFFLPITLTYSVEMTGTETGMLGLDFVVPVGESQAKVATWEDIPIHLGSKVRGTVGSEDVTYGLILESGEVVEVASVGEINASDIAQPTSVSTLVDNVELYWSMGWLKNVDIKDGLLDKLNAAQKSLDQGKTKVAKNQLGALINQVQSDSNVDPRARDFLVAYAQHIIDNL
jgi:hypothetical protein